MIRTRGPYDVILSNILANPLCEMARDLANHLARDGTAILAGLLERQASQVIASHQAYGLFLRRKIRPWTLDNIGYVPQKDVKLSIIGYSIIRNRSIR